MQPAEELQKEAKVFHEEMLKTGKWKPTPLTTRGKAIRKATLKLSHAHGGYHYGGSFSCVEILMAVYDRLLDTRFGDVFIMSKGHSCWPLYVILRERGKYPKLEGHPYRDVANGIEWTTGSLGHGLPAAVGKAWAKSYKADMAHVYVLMSDGELQEGTTWESALVAAHRHFYMLTVLVDWNQIQGSDWCESVCSVHNVPKAIQALGWEVEHVDGHNPREIWEACRSRPRPAPKMVICHTIKARGVKDWEANPAYHAKWPSQDEYNAAIKELE